MRYDTPIGRLHVEAEWPALHLALRARCGKADPLDRDFRLSVKIGDAPSIEPGWVPIMDGFARPSRDSILFHLPERSFSPGMLIDWLWLSLAYWCYPEGWQPVHAAAAERDGEVTLVLGPGGSGKTTVLLDLLDRGWKLLADDCVLFDPETRRVLPWGADLHLSANVVQERWPDLAGGTVDYQGKVRLKAERLGYQGSEGGVLARTIALARPGPPLCARHEGIGPVAHTQKDEAWLLEQLGQVEWVGARPVPGQYRKEEVPPFAQITLFEGKEWCLDRWLEGWFALQLPSDAHVLWCYNGGEGPFWDRLQDIESGLALDYPNLIVWRDPHRVGMKDRQVAYLYQQARTRIPPECEFAFMLEDDVIPDADAFRAMVEEWQRWEKRPVVGVPVPILENKVAPYLLAWTYRKQGDIEVRQGEFVYAAVRQTRPDLVDGISFSCTIVPKEALDAASLSHGMDGMAASGYDHLFSLEMRERGTPIVALWDKSAVHMKQDGDVTMDVARILSVDGRVPENSAWTVESCQELPDDLSGFDYLVWGDISARYLHETIGHLAFHNRAGIVWGWWAAPDGLLGPGSEAGAVVRASCLQPGRYRTLADVRKQLAVDGWTEDHAPVVSFPVPSPEPTYVPTTIPRREQSPYKVLMVNRDPRDAKLGFGGDLVQVESYRSGLRALGVWADVRTSDYPEHDGYDLVHLHHCQFDWAHRAAGNCRPGRPVVLSPITFGRPRKEGVKWVVEKADLLTCYARAEAAAYAEMFPRKRIRVIPMGVPSELYALNGHVVPDQETVFMAGKVCGHKNQLAVLEACRNLGVKVRFAGWRDSTQLEYWEDFRAKVEAYPGATFLGRLSGDALWDEYRSAHVHACATLFEPFGLVTLEALAAGANVVHTRNSWAAEQYGKVGSLCDPADVSSVEQALDTELRRRRGWGRVRPPTWTEAAASLKAAYEEALGR